MKKKKENKREQRISYTKIGNTIVFGPSSLIQEYPYTFGPEDFEKERKK